MAYDIYAHRNDDTDVGLQHGRRLSKNHCGSDRSDLSIHLLFFFLSILYFYLLASPFFTPVLNPAVKSAGGCSKIL